MTPMPNTRVEIQDKSTAIYHVIYASETFEESVQILFKLVRTAQEKCPGKSRLLYLDIEGHRNAAGGFDADMLELQSEFLCGTLMPFLSEAHVPLMEIRNPKPQRNDVPNMVNILPAPDPSPNLTYGPTGRSGRSATSWISASSKTK